MESILIEPKKKDDIKLLSQLAKKLGYHSRIISQQEKEDLGLAFVIRKFRKKDYVKEESIFKSLDKRK
jgi:hypothetical protein